MNDECPKCGRLLDEFDQCWACDADGAPLARKASHPERRTIMTDTAPTLTAPQALIAHALAAAHGHHWATALTALEVIGMTSRQISDKACAVLEPGIGCAHDCPSIDADGYVEHTTMTGRLTWSIAPDGHTRIKVYRPHPDGQEQEPVEVIGVNLPPFRYEDDGENPLVTDWNYVSSGRYDDGQPLIYPMNVVLPLQRHLDAAIEATQVLVHIVPCAADALAYLRSDGVAAIIAANEGKEVERRKEAMAARFEDIRCSQGDMTLLVEVALDRLQTLRAAHADSPHQARFDAIRTHLAALNE